MGSYSGQYQSEAYACHTIFRSLSILLTLLCFIFCILSLVLPMVTLKDKAKDTTLVTFYIFHTKTNSTLVEKGEEVENIRYDEIADITKKSEGPITGSRACAIIALVASILALIFTIVFLTLFCFYQRRRRVADEERKEVYRKAKKKRVDEDEEEDDSDSDDDYSHRSSDSEEGRWRLQCTPAEVEKMNERLRVLREEERGRRRVDQGIGITLTVLFLLLFLMALLAVILMGVYRGDSLNAVTSNKDDFKKLLKELNVDKRDDYVYTDSSLPYKAGFILLIIVIILAVVLLILLVVPIIEAFYLCGRPLDIKDKTFEAVENTQSEAPRAPPNTEMPPPPFMPHGKNGFPTAAPGPYGDTAYGVPIDQNAFSPPVSNENSNYTNKSNNKKGFESTDCKHNSNPLNGAPPPVYDYPNKNNNNNNNSDNNNNNNNNNDGPHPNYKDLGLPSAAYRNNKNIVS